MSRYKLQGRTKQGWQTVHVVSLSRKSCWGQNLRTRWNWSTFVCFDCLILSRKFFYTHLSRRSVYWKHLTTIAMHAFFLKQATVEWLQIFSNYRFTVLPQELVTSRSSCSICEKSLTFRVQMEIFPYFISTVEHRERVRPFPLHVTWREMSVHYCSSSFVSCVAVVCGGHVFSWRKDFIQYKYLYSCGQLEVWFGKPVPVQQCCRTTSALVLLRKTGIFQKVTVIFDLMTTVYHISGVIWRPWPHLCSGGWNCIQ